MRSKADGILNNNLSNQPTSCLPKPKEEEKKPEENPEDELKSTLEKILKKNKDVQKSDLVLEGGVEAVNVFASILAIIAHLSEELSEVILGPIVEAAGSIDWQKILKSVSESDAKDLLNKINEINSSVIKIKDIGRNRVNRVKLNLPKDSASEEKSENNKDAVKIINNGIEKYLDLPTGTVDTLEQNYNKVKGIDRTNEEKEISKLPKNNDEFFEKERNYSDKVFMKINANLNQGRPDARLFMDIALEGPKNVPSTQDYQFVSSERNAELNQKFDLTGNKKIPSHYDGFIFNENSPTAIALNNSDEFRDQIFDEKKNYDSVKGVFKSNKLEIEFEKDKNLQYSFGHMTVLNPKIEDGYVTGLGYDKYDYSLLYNEYYNDHYKAATLNNSAKWLQMTANLLNFYVFVPIKVKI